MGLLDGDIKNLMGSVMGSFYLDGTLVQVTLVPDGQGGGTETTTTQSVKVQEDIIREENRSLYSQNAKRFIVLQAGVTGSLDGDCRLTVGGVTYALSRPEQDPAKAYWYVIGVPV